MAEGPPEPADERLQGAHRVGRRVAVPYLVDEHGGRNGAAGTQSEDGEQGAQPRPTDGDGRAVVAECLGRPEDAVAHAPILRDRDREVDTRTTVPVFAVCRDRSSCSHPSRNHRPDARRL